MEKQCLSLVSMLDEISGQKTAYHDTKGKEITPWQRLLWAKESVEKTIKSYTPEAISQRREKLMDEHIKKHDPIQKEDIASVREKKFEEASTLTPAQTQEVKRRRQIAWHEAIRLSEKEKEQAEKEKKEVHNALKTLSEEEKQQAEEDKQAKLKKLGKPSPPPRD